MKLAFTVDGKVYYDKNCNYYSRSFSGLYERYRYLADEISFLVRTEPIENELKNMPLSSNIKIISIPDFKKLNKYFELRHDAKKIIEKHIRESDIVILRIPSSISEIAIKYVKKYNKAYLVESVGCPLDSYRNHSMLGKIIAPSEYIKTRRIIKNAKYVIYVTERFLQKRYPTNGTYCCISDVELQSLENDIIKKRINKILNKSSNIILGTAGTIEIPYKGQQYVIKALSMLKKKGINNIKYHLAGGGDKSRLLKLAKKLCIEDQVIFDGVIPHNEIFGWFDKIDIYIQPSTVEGLPRAVVEAMSRACPVIGSRVGGIPETIKDDCLFRKANSTAIEEMIISMSKDKMLRTARENFIKANEFDVNILSLKRKNIYDKILRDLRK